jgi:hypothetical protein
MAEGVNAGRCEERQGAQSGSGRVLRVGRGGRAALRTFEAGARDVCSAQGIVLGSYAVCRRDREGAKRLQPFCAAKQPGSSTSSSSRLQHHPLYIGQLLRIHSCHVETQNPDTGRQPSAHSTAPHRIWASAKAMSDVICWDSGSV